MIVPLSNNPNGTEVDDSDFQILSQYKWKMGGDGYAVRNVYVSGGKYKTILMHRYLLDPEDGMVIDHIDGNPLNNKRSNLRVCTRKQNMSNMKKPITNASGYKGVHFHKNTTDKVWMAQIRINNKNKFLGAFTSPVEAAKEYDLHAVAVFGIYAKLNFPKLEEAE